MNQGTNDSVVEYSNTNQLETPILFIVFNRFECTKQVLSEIRKAKPKRLYISSDGSRDAIENEDFKISEEQ